MVRTDSGKPARESRSNRVGRELAQLRRRNAEQLAQAREQERRVDEALRDYAAATTRIASADAAHEAKVQRLRDRIDKLTATHADALEQDVRAQAAAVRQISDSGRTVRDLAELLDLSQRAVGRLLERSRDVEESGDSDAMAVPPQTRSASPSAGDDASAASADATETGHGVDRAAGGDAGDAPDVPHAVEDEGTADLGWALDGAGEESG